MMVKTDSERVRLSAAGSCSSSCLLRRPFERRAARRVPERYAADPNATGRRRRPTRPRPERTGHHVEPDGQTAATVPRR